MTAFLVKNAALLISSYFIHIFVVAIFGEIIPNENSLEELVATILFMYIGWLILELSKNLKVRLKNADK